MMKAEKTFYKMTMDAAEEGIAIFTEKFTPIHEAACFYYCVRERDIKRFVSPLMNDGETKMQLAVRIKIKVFRIAKSGSRIAFETEDKAFKNLIFLKNRQLGHLKRNLAIVREFIDRTNGKSLSDFASDGWQRTIPETLNLVREHYRFD
jgi:hypothetical protein